MLPAGVPVPSPGPAADYGTIVHSLQNQVNALQGENLSLRAQLDAVQFVEFVGSAYGHNDGTKDWRSDNHVALQVVGRAAKHQAETQFAEWRERNPYARIVGRRLEIIGHPVAYNGTAVVSNVTAVIHVTYR